MNRHPVSLICFAASLAALGLMEASLAPAPAAAQGTDPRLIRERDVDNDGEVELVLENRFFRLVVKPSLGGVGRSLVYKATGEELLVSTAMEAGGILQDCVWQQGQRGDWFNAGYAYQILDNSAEHGAVKLWRRGTTGSLSWLTITKTLTIHRDACRVDVDYEYSNLKESMAPLTYGFWVHNNLSVAGQENTYYLPSSRGVLQRRLARTGASEDWVYDATRGWTAVVGEKGSGIAACMDYRNLMCLYNYYSIDLKTVEWMLRSQKINNGEAFTTRCTFIPFRGLPSVEGVEGGVVGSIEAPESPAVGQPAALVVRVAAPQRRSLTVRVARRLLPEGPWVDLAQGPLALEPDQCGELTARFTPDNPGTYVIRASLEEQGKPSGDFEKPLVVGAESGKYTLAAREPRLGSADERFGTVSEPGEYRKDITLSEAIETPHIRWAKPYYLGKTRALFIMPQVAQRDIIELAQRMSLEFDRVTTSQSWSTSGDLCPDFGSRDTNENLRSLLKSKPYDVIVLAAAQWQKWLEEDVRQAILARVRQGAGLVWITPTDLPDDLWKTLPLGKPDTHVRPNGQWRQDQAHPITVGTPFEAMPRTSFQPFPPQPQAQVLASVGSEYFGYRPLVAVGSHEQGRVVCLSYNPPDNYPPGCVLTPNLSAYRNPRVYAFKEFDDAFCSFHYWEYAYALLIKSMLWSCGKEPELALARLAPSAPRLTAADAGKATIELTLRNSREPADIRIDLTVRDAFSQVEAGTTQTVRVGAGQQTVSLSLPAGLSGGLHFAELILRNGEFVVNWGTTSFEVARAVTIATVAPDHPLSASRASTARVSVGLRGTGPATVVATLVDGWGRAVARTEAAAAVSGTGTVVIPVKLERLRTQAGRVRVEVFVDGHRQDRRDKRLLVTQPQAWDDFRYTMNIYPGAFHYSPQFLRQVREDGVTDCQTGLSGRGVGTMVDAGFTMRGIELVPFFHFHHSPARAQLYQDMKTSYQKTHDKRYLVRDPCVNNPDFRAATRQRVRNVVGHFSRYGTYDYCLTDELSITAYGDAYDFCFCEHCLRAFRQWARGVYGTLAALNQEWDTQFASFDDVMPMTYDEDRANPAPWADHRSFMEFTLHDYVRFVRDEVHRIDPRAGISLSGTQAPQAYGGDDVWLRTQVYDAVHQYGHGGQYRMHPSFKPGMGISPWGGYGSHGPGVEATQWSNVFNGATGMSFWWYPLCWNPDFSLSECGRDYKAATRPLREGLGKLLMNARAEDYGIGLHYSQPSIHAAFFNRADSQFSENREGWMTLLTDLGLQYSFVAYRQVETGELTRHPYRVLILPSSLALSSAEVTQIRQFVEQGGLLIADARTGVMDDHCKPQGGGRLDDLFGIRRADNAARPAEGELKVGADDEGLGVAGATIPAVAQEAGLSLNGGKALVAGAPAPAVIVNKVGKGTAVYLNFLLSQYVNLRTGGKQKEQPLKDLLQGLVRRAGIRPVATVSEVAPGGSAPRLECQVFGFRQGTTSYVGLLPAIPKTSPEQSWETTVTFAQPATVYDVLDRKALGNTTQVRTRLAAGKARLYALLPYRVSGLALQAPTQIAAGEAAQIAARLQTEGGTPGLHVGRFEVCDPSGKLRPEHTANLLSHDGAFSATVDFALDYPPGKWTLRVRDVATGAAATTSIELLPGPAAAHAPQAVPAGGAPVAPALLWERREPPTRARWVPAAQGQAPAVVAAPNLLSNPTLLEDADKDGSPDGWRVGGEQGCGKVTFRADPTVLYHGAPATRLTIGPTEASKHWSLVQTLTPLLKDYRGKSLSLSVQMFRDKPRREGPYDCDLRIRQWSRDGKFLGDVVTKYVPIKPGLWQSFGGTGVVKPETAALELLVEGSERLGETFWLADLHLGGQ